MDDENEQVALINKDEGKNNPSYSTIEEKDQENKLRRTLTFSNAFVTIVTCLLGSGVYFSPALVARRTPNAFISMIIFGFAGFISYLGSLCYCELTGLYKKTGSTYIFIHETYGRYVSLPSLLVMVLMMSPFGYSVVLLNASVYICSAFIEDDTSMEYYWSTRILALVMMYVIVFVSCLGAKTSAVFSTIVNIIQVLSIVLLVVAGIYYLASKHDVSNFQSEVFFNNTKEGLENDMASISASLFSALFCFDGWFIIASLAEEVKNPKRNIILVAGISIPFVTFLYLLVLLSCLAVLSHEELGATDVVFAYVFERIGIRVAKYIVPFIVFISMSSAASSAMFHMSRFMLSASREGQLPKFLSLIHRKRGTPIPAIFCIAFLNTIALFCGFDIETNLQTFNFGIWLEYGIAFTTVLYMRYKKPQHQRIYKVWITTPIFMCLISACLIVLLIYKIPWVLAIFAVIVSLSILVNKLFMNQKERRLISEKLDGFSDWLTRKTNLVVNEFDDENWEK